MSDEKPNASDVGIFEKPDERRKIDAERPIYLARGGLITVYPPVEMDRRGKRTVAPPVKMGYFKNGVGAKSRWYPGYIPAAADRATPEDAAKFQAWCEERKNKTKRGRTPPQKVD
jgi:hypothetical protein